MNNHVEKIKNSLFVDISRISHDQIFKNRYANYWRALHKLLIGVSVSLNESVFSILEMTR